MRDAKILHSYMLPSVKLDCGRCGGCKSQWSLVSGGSTMRTKVIEKASETGKNWRCENPRDVRQPSGLSRLVLSESEVSGDCPLTYVRGFWRTIGLCLFGLELINGPYGG
ncbi:unnamed protein product [Cuscuta epithymum]|uniref:Uncharacterized protein n=1 Tax=Cuscuta epithymum TaxID=186058 RepID=A0AAV0C2G1_9ASTE|nr:unnamed protein product [Cuscuta epithymum]CAH9145943.1 unnamed protein product [Cuscuta epithymum]